MLEPVSKAPTELGFLADLMEMLVVFDVMEMPEGVKAGFLPMRRSELGLAGSLSGDGGAWLKLPVIMLKETGEPAGELVGVTLLTALNTQEMCCK